MKSVASSMCLILSAAANGVSGQDSQRHYFATELNIEWSDFQMVHANYAGEYEAEYGERQWVGINWNAAYIMYDAWISNWLTDLSLWTQDGVPLDEKYDITLANERFVIETEAHLGCSIKLDRFVVTPQKDSSGDGTVRERNLAAYKHHVEVKFSIASDAGVEPADVVSKMAESDFKTALPAALTESVKELNALFIELAWYVSIATPAFTIADSTQMDGVVAHYVTKTTVAWSDIVDQYYGAESGYGQWSDYDYYTENRSYLPDDRLIGLLIAPDTFYRSYWHETSVMTMFREEVEKVLGNNSTVHVDGYAAITPVADAPNPYESDSRRRLAAWQHEITFKWNFDTASETVSDSTAVLLSSDVSKTALAAGMKAVMEATFAGYYNSYWLTLAADFTIGDSVWQSPAMFAATTAAANTTMAPTTKAVTTAATTDDVAATTTTVAPDTTSGALATISVNTFTWIAASVFCVLML